MKYTLPFLLVVLFSLLLTTTQAQQPPFWHEVQAFRQSDSISMPPQDAILFVGSSTFTRWQDVQSYFPGYAIVNRAFGGSTLADQIRYANQVILPYHPRQVVIYCGENDFMESDTISANTVALRFVQLFTLLRDRQPELNIAFVSIKPSPSRRNRWPAMEQANTLISGFLRQQVHAAFIDIYQQMKGAQQQGRPELFGDDQLHLNSKGYLMWQKAILPYLLK